MALSSKISEGGPIAVPVPALYQGGHFHAPLFAALGIVGFVANLLILFYGGAYFGGHHKLVSQLAIGAWVLLPPLWFFYEFFYYFPAHGNPEAGFDRLKGSQDASSKVWAAVALLLAGIYTARLG